MAGRVQGKIALITGAARGQGRSHAVRLAEEGADIIAVDICGQVDTVTDYELATAEDLQQTVAEVEKFGGRIISRRADVRDFEALQLAINEGIEALGGLDIVVANAGIVSFGDTWTVTEAQWKDVMDVNLTGAWHTVKATVPHLLQAKRGGSLIFTSSLCGVKGMENLGHYVASKHGVIGLMRTLAHELGRHSIRVNSINPTNVDTPMIQHATVRKLAVPRSGEPTMAEFNEAFAAMNLIPVPYVDVVDISNAVLFLASDESRYITGTSLPVDAGAAER